MARVFVGDIKAALNWSVFPALYARLFFKLMVRKLENQLIPDHLRAQTIYMPTRVMTDTFSNAIFLSIVMMTAVGAISVGAVHFTAREAFKLFKQLTASRQVSGEAADVHEEDAPEAMQAHSPMTTSTAHLSKAFKTGSPMPPSSPKETSNMSADEKSLNEEEVINNSSDEPALFERPRPH